MEDVKLHGTWSSPFSYRIIWALKLKGLKYEYIEEDLFNKSNLLLQYNPVYKKIPILVHGGKPISESVVILEYIEETWPHNPLLPKDIHEKAVARFWIKFGEDKMNNFVRFFMTVGAEQEQARQDSLDILRTLEKDALGEKKFFGGETIGMVDIVFGWLTYSLENADYLGKSILEEDMFPRLCAWIKNFKENSVIKENLPDPDKLLAYFKINRERITAAA